MPRQCCEPICSAMFAVCATCDRGQRYCSELCRSRRRVTRQARRDGRALPTTGVYREWLGAAPVTHQAYGNHRQADYFGAALGWLSAPILGC